MRHRAQGSLLGDNSTTSSPKPVGVLNLGKAVAVTVRRAQLRGHSQEGRRVLGLQRLRPGGQQHDRHRTPAGEAVRVLMPLALDKSLAQFPQ